MTTLTEAMEQLAALLPRPVAPTRLPAGAALGRVLAADLIAGADLPPVAVAALDGVAVRAAELDGAGPYAPVVLVQPPRLALGENLPPDADAVLAAHSVAWRGDCAELAGPAAPGEGVRPPGRDIAAGTVWRRQGARLSHWDLPLLAALGMKEVAVRIPRIALLPTGAAAADASSACLAALLAAEGATVQLLPPIAGRDRIAAALARAVGRADLVITTGGTGEGRDDHTAAALADAGTLAVHGIGLRPGSTAGFGAIAGTPVILLPGRPADALGCWLVLATPAVRRLSGASSPPARKLRLARKLVSTPGIAELALLAAAGDGMVPLAIADLPLAAFAQAQSFLLVPAGREGADAGDVLECHELRGPA